MADNLLENLNPEQKEAVEHGLGPLLIVAGAGTGKTTVITKKIAHLIQTGAAGPEEILALTFTEKAAEEMLRRVEQQMNIGYMDMQISTFHAFAEKLLEYHGLEIGLPNRFRLLNDTDCWLLVRKNIAKLKLDIYRPLGNPIRHIHELLRHFHKCKDELISPEDYLNYSEEIILNRDGSPVDDTESARLKELAGAYREYNQILLDNACLDFADLIYYGVKLLKDRPDLLRRLRARYKYILVDEFQDVNWAQYYLVKLLAGQRPNLTVVGDDDQSIYAFRGASVSNILSFKKDFPEAREIVLRRNYRSCQSILDLAYKSIQNNNPYRLEIKLNIAKKLSSDRAGSMDSVQRLQFDNSDEEARAVAKEILAVKEADPGAAFDDFAILVRARNHADRFIAELARRGIPSEFLSSAGLYRQAIVADALNFFRAAVNCHSAPAVYRLLCLPFLKIDESELHEILEYAHKKSTSYFNAIKNPPADLSENTLLTLKKIANVISAGAGDARLERPTVVLYKFLDAVGYLSYLAKGENGGDKKIIGQIYELQRWFEYITMFQNANPGAKVYDFLEHYGYILESGDQGENYLPADTPNSVNILTAHAAKGLEFKYVFVVNLTEERFPTRPKGRGIEIPSALIKEQLPEGDTHYQEERRLFYVAVTRAKNRLYLTSADDYGGIRKKKISRFISEISTDESIIASDRIKTKKLLADIKDTGINAPLVTDDVGRPGEVKVFSYTQLRAYEDCPYRYKLAYILKIPTRGNASQSFGESIHLTLRDFYAKIAEINSVSQNSLFSFGKIDDKTQKTGSIIVPTLNDLLVIYKKNWIADWYDTETLRELYFKKGEGLLRRFYALHTDKWSVPLAWEANFKIKVGDYVLKGRIDRIDRAADGKLSILDYKTGGAKENLSARDKEQLILYQMALETLPEYNKLGAVASLTYFYLANQTAVSFTGSQEEKNKLAAKILILANKINSGDFTAKPEKFTCSLCPFRDICDYKK